MPWKEWKFKKKKNIICFIIKDKGETVLLIKGGVRNGGSFSCGLAQKLYNM